VVLQVYFQRKSTRPEQVKMYRWMWMYAAHTRHRQAVKVFHLFCYITPLHRLLEVSVEEVVRYLHSFRYVINFIITRLSYSIINLRDPQA
jgi:hypothetical protein